MNYSNEIAVNTKCSTFEFPLVKWFRNFSKDDQYLIQAIQTQLRKCVTFNTESRNKVRLVPRVKIFLAS